MKMIEKKMAKEYKDVVFEPVLMAELRDDDMISADDHYYKVVDMKMPAVQMAINEQIDTENLEEVLMDQGTYEQRRDQNKMIKAKEKQIRQDYKKLLISLTRRV